MTGTTGTAGTTGTTKAVVRTWSNIDGWGVVDSADTPGGCFVHFSVVEKPGYRSLTPGTEVELEWEALAFDQDGFRYSALRVTE
jgi:CspA family cold shock protein